MSNKAFLGRPSAVVKNHNRVNLFHPLSTRNPNHDAFSDRWMLCKCVFDFQRKNILTAGDDHVFHTIDDMEKSVFIKSATVASVHPAISNGSLCFFRPTPISKHHGFAAHTDFTDLSCRNDIVMFINDANLEAITGPSCGPVGTPGSILSVQVFVVQSRALRELRHPVGLYELRIRERGDSTV